MLIMTSIIRVSQSKFVTVPIDEDSSERVMNCIQTLSELSTDKAVHEAFLDDTKSAYSKMLTAQEVSVSPSRNPFFPTVSIVTTDDDVFW